MFELADIHDYKYIILENPNLNGLTVTSPFKQTIIPYITLLSDTAQQIGAVNVIDIKRKNHQIELYGYNTDYWGFEQALKKQLNGNEQYAIVLGNGGAAKAVEFVLHTLGFQYVLVSRTKSTKTITYNELSDNLLKKADIIINATPLGLFPNVNTCPEINYDCLSPKHLLFDLNYNPTMTLFMQKGYQQGARVVNGYDMLCFQADKAWTIWNKN